MVKNDLIDRYIYAVTKHMKSAMKKDVAAELETIIQDMLEERCEDVTPTERDIKVVLTELGTPNELASKYKGETQDCLIGQPYYSLYVYVLKIVTVCISGGMLLAQIMAALTSHTIWYIAIYRTIGGIFGGILTGFAFVTLLFAFFYKKGIKVDGLNDGIDNLPPVPQKSNRISKVDAIVGIVFSVIFTLVFLVCPQILCIAFVKNGVGVYEPLFNLEYIRQTWYFILAFGILGVTRDSVRLIDGSYTKRVMLVTIITNIIDGVLTSIWLLNDRIMNSGFFDDKFLAPHSRHTEVPQDLLEKDDRITILADSEEAGVYLCMAQDGRQIFVMGHPEYDRMTLDSEYKRDLGKGLNPQIPENYYPNDDPEKKPMLSWRAHCNNLYTNWLNYYVYQVTPYDLYGTPF